MILMGAITWPLEGVGPENLYFFGPKKVLIFRAHPFQRPWKWRFSLSKSLCPRNSTPPPALCSYTRALLFRQDRRHLFVKRRCILVSGSNMWGGRGGSQKHADCSTRSKLVVSGVSCLPVKNFFLPVRERLPCGIAFVVYVSKPCIAYSK